MTEPAARSRVVWRIVRWTLRQTVRLFAVFGAATLVYLACFGYCRAKPKSMEPTLQAPNWADADRVLIEKASYWFRQPRRWEVVAFQAPDGEILVRRVVGLPGEKISISDNGGVVIDGREVARPAGLDFLDYFPFGNVTADQAPADCGDGYYVLGDFARDINDSRFNGPVPPEQLIGRAWLIVGPSGRRGFVDR